MEEKKKALESMLLACRQPLRPVQVSKILGISAEEVLGLIEILKVEYSGRGLKLIEAADGFRIGTNPAYAAYVEAVVNPALEVELSPASLEALAIISYKQPATRGDIEKIRGVDSSGVIKYLLELELIQEVGRGEGLGRPILYATSELFLEKFGLKNLTDLPPWQDIGRDISQELTIPEALPENSLVTYPPMDIISSHLPPQPGGNPLLN